MAEMKIEKTIEIICDAIIEEVSKENAVNECQGLPNMIVALAELISARATMN